MTEPITRLNPSQLGDTSDYGFTNIVSVPAGKRLVFISGQGGRSDDGSMGDFETQLKQSFARLRMALAEVGATPEQAVKITVLSVDHNMDKLKLISAERNAMWPDDLLKPASTLIPVPRLASDDMLFEMDAIAAI